MPVLITPPALSYRIGETITVDFTSDVTVAGHTLTLRLFDLENYSDPFGTETADGSGNATFANAVIPSFSTGADRYLIVRDETTLGEDFSDPFELLAAAARGQQQLGLGLGLGL